MEINIDLHFWLEMIMFILVGIVLVALVSNLTLFSEAFKSVDPEVTGTLLWALFILFALQSFKLPNFKRKKGYERLKEGYR